MKPAQHPPKPPTPADLLADKHTELLRLHLMRFSLSFKSMPDGAVCINTGDFVSILKEHITNIITEAMSGSQR